MPDGVIMSAPSVELVGLFPEATTLPRPDPGESYAIYKVAGFSESGVQAFIRLVQPLGLAMARSTMPLKDVDKVGRVAAALADDLADGKLDETEILTLILLLKKIAR